MTLQFASKPDLIVGLLGLEVFVEGWNDVSIDVIAPEA